MADKGPPFAGQMPSSFDGNQDFYNERPMQKVVRKIKEEPLVPLGIGLTVFAFVNAYRALRRGDSKQANKMFRARVAAQGFTVVAMVAGSMYYSQDRQKTKELRKIKEERDAEVKRQSWIRELEVRDEEEKAIRAKLQKRAQQKQEDQQQQGSAATTGEGANVDEANKESKGGILGKMGLWSAGEKAAAEAAAADEAAKDTETTTDKKKRDNPRSSLGAIGEAMTSKKKKDDEEPKK